MAMDINKAASDFLKTPVGAKLSGKEEELGKLVGSPEGQKVRQMLSGEEDKVLAAIHNGDTATLKDTLSYILKTEEGARLAEQLRQMMGS